MSDRKVFQDSVTPLPDQPGLTQHGLMVNAAGPEHRDETMTLLFSLAIPQEAQAELEVLSQTLDKGERDYHFLLLMQPAHRTAPPAFGTRFRWFPVVPCEWRA
jgi:hypothetical protein